MSALDNQVGGQHYKGAYQPLQLICKMQMNFTQGNILKYPSRFRDKNGKEDLHKAIHYCQLGAELEPINVTRFSKKEATLYVKLNNLPEDFVEFIEQICNQNWLWCMEYINKIKDVEYGSES